MKSFTSNPGQSPTHLATGYPWSDIPSNSTIIDIGGSEGHVSLAIAQRHSHLSFVVQDLPEVIEAATLPGDVDEGVKGRVRFEVHDFLTDQTTRGEVFLLRWILHDWPDQYVVRILRHLRPALRPGNKILVNDLLMPEPGSVATVVERQIRCVSLLQDPKKKKFKNWHVALLDHPSLFGPIFPHPPRKSSFVQIKIANRLTYSTVWKKKKDSST